MVSTANLHPYTARLMQELHTLMAHGHAVGRCKLDPSLKVTCFQTLNLRVHTVPFNLKLVSELVPLQRGGVRAADVAQRSARHDASGKAVV